MTLGERRRGVGERRRGEERFRPVRLITSVAARRFERRAGEAARAGEATRAGEAARAGKAVGTNTGVGTMRLRGFAGGAGDRVRAGKAALACTGVGTMRLWGLEGSSTGDRAAGDRVLRGDTLLILDPDGPDAVLLLGDRERERDDPDPPDDVFDSRRPLFFICLRAAAISSGGYRTSVISLRRAFSSSW